MLAVNRLGGPSSQARGWDLLCSCEYRLFRRASSSYLHIPQRITDHTSARNDKEQLRHGFPGR